MGDTVGCLCSSYSLGENRTHKKRMWVKMPLKHNVTQSEPYFPEKKSLHKAPGKIFLPKKRRTYSLGVFCFMGWSSFLGGRWGELTKCYLHLLSGLWQP